MNIRPVSDLRYKFPEIEHVVKEGETVYLTKNGYGSMVVMSLDKYSELSEMADRLDKALEEADRIAESTTERMTHEEVFSKLRGLVNAKEAL